MVCIAVSIRVDLEMVNGTENAENAENDARRQARTATQLAAHSGYHAWSSSGLIATALLALLA